MQKDLKERTKKFSLRIIRMYAALPKNVVAQVIGKQFLRSGTSIGANYREAYRARSHTEFISKMNVCVSELEETIYWLELLVESGTISSSVLQSLNQETHELIAIFISIITTKKKNLCNL